MDAIAAVDPILQLHSSRHCNLACRHCYSTSGPDRKGTLSTAIVEALLADAAEDGYRILSLSGGEPLMDPGLFAHIAAARRHGLAVTLVSNGTLIDARAADRLAGAVSLVAISIDGPPALHDEIRAAAGSFTRTCEGIRQLRLAGIRFAIIHTARMKTLAHLRWLAGFARDEGASLLQLHPIEGSGRARVDLASELDDGDLSTRVAVMARLLTHDMSGEGAEGEAGALTGALPIHVDVLPIEALAATRRRAVCAIPDDAPLARWIDPLVVEDDGTVVPWTYGIDRRLALGNLRADRLCMITKRYREAGLAAALAHANAVRDRLVDQAEWPFVNWFAALAEERQAGS